MLSIGIFLCSDLSSSSLIDKVFTCFGKFIKADNSLLIQLPFLKFYRFDAELKPNLGLINHSPT